jgi:S-adenosylmethionine hydrolase
VGKNKPLIFRDDYGRVEIALNHGSFVKKYPTKIGDGISIRK